MKKYLLLTLLVLFCMTFTVQSSRNTPEKIIYFFYIDGCGDCYEAKDVLQVVNLGDAEIKYLDVRLRKNELLRERFDDAYQVPGPLRGLVPALFIGGDYFGHSITTENVQTAIAEFDYVLYAEKMAQIFGIGRGALQLLGLFWSELARKGSLAFFEQLALVNLLILVLVRVWRKAVGLTLYLIGGVIGYLIGTNFLLNLVWLKPVLICLNVCVLGILFIELYQDRAQLIMRNSFSAISLQVGVTFLGAVSAFLLIETQVWQSFQSIFTGFQWVIPVALLTVQMLSVIAGGIIFGLWQIYWHERHLLVRLGRFIHMIILVFLLTIFALEYLR